MAAGLQDAFRQAGICVPDDISLICNDTVNETLPGYLHLTSVDQEPQVMALPLWTFCLSGSAIPNSLRIRSCTPLLYRNAGA